MRFVSLTLSMCLVSFCSMAQTGPSFSCESVQPESTEQRICSDPQLSALDRELSEVYAGASQKAVNEHPPVLKAEQRGWIKGRDDCWKSDDISACIETAYTLRIAELQARYQLIEGRGPVRYTCEGDERNEFYATFYPTEPPSMIAERGDQSSLMFQQPAASGSRYEGQNNSFWEHQGEAKLVWGYQTPELSCKPMQ